MYSIPHGFYDQTHPTASPHPVGTRGGCEEVWGPCACPRRYTSRLDIARTDRTCTRTGTLPPVPTGWGDSLPGFILNLLVSIPALPKCARQNRLRLFQRRVAWHR